MNIEMNIFISFMNSFLRMKNNENHKARLTVIPQQPLRQLLLVVMYRVMYPLPVYHIRCWFIRNAQQPIKY